MEFVIAAIIVLTACYILYKNLNKSSKGNCNCNNCNSKCSKYKK